MTFKTKTKGTEIKMLKRRVPSDLRYGKMSNINRQLVLQQLLQNKLKRDVVQFISSMNHLKYSMQQINWTVFERFEV